MSECAHNQCEDSAQVVLSYDVEAEPDDREYHGFCYAHMEELWCTPLTIPEVHNTVQTIE